MSDILTRLTHALESRYRVNRQIGAGGMATVYLAHDLRHERDVAIKVLHPDLAAALGAERFLAEIKTTAKLQHPHILPLLDSGEADGLLFYVMPYVAGESLRTRLERETQISVDDAVRIAREVASALESAHRIGVVHRDIKPENILLHEDQALVADFGIALAVSAAGGQRMTQTGLSLGTPQYMAPEQAMGERVVDARADIYALGAVLYEMLVGEPPFTGPTVQAIVARVMTEQPRSLVNQRKSVPPNIDAATMKALEKLPADRFSSAADFNKALASPGFAPTANTAPQAISQPGSRKTGWRDFLPWSIAGLALVLAAASVVRRAARGEEQPLLRLSIELPSGMRLDPTSGANIDLSDDGSILAFAVTSGGPAQIAIRHLSSDTLTIVSGSAGTNGSVELSPDNRWVAFGADLELRKALVTGGAPITLGESRWAHIAWVGNEGLVFTRNYDTGLTRVSADGRDTTSITTPDRAKGELGHWWPQLLPDGDHVLFTNYRTPADKSTIEVLSLRSGEREVVLESGYHARYASGYLIFARGLRVLAAPFNERSRKTTGDAMPLPISVRIVAQNGWSGFGVSGNGVLAYLHDPKSPIELSLVDEGGVAQAAETAPGDFSGAVQSPDGRKIGAVRNGDVWVLDRTRQIWTRLTSTDQVETSLTWSPDSRTLYYVRDVPVFDIFRRAVDAGSPEEVVVASQSDKTPSAVSPDGLTLLFEHDDEGDDIEAVRLDSIGTARPRKFISEQRNQLQARYSPDGMWVVYSSSESGRYEVYLVSSSRQGNQARQQLSVDGGSDPHWGPDGRTVYWGNGGRIQRVRVNPRTGDIGRPETLDKLPTDIAFWSVGADGRFLIGKPAKGGEPMSLKVVTNWPALLTRAP